MNGRSRLSNWNLICITRPKLSLPYLNATNYRHIKTENWKFLKNYFSKHLHHESTWKKSSIIFPGSSENCHFCEKSSFQNLSKIVTFHFSHETRKSELLWLCEGWNVRRSFCFRFHSQLSRRLVTKPQVQHERGVERHVILHCELGETSLFTCVSA